MNAAVIIHDFEQRVRDRAYALWENEGRPSGRDREHWRLSEAATLAELTPAAPTKQAAKPKAAPRKKSAAPNRPAASAQMAAAH